MAHDPTRPLSAVGDDEHRTCRCGCRADGHMVVLLNTRAPFHLRSTRVPLSVSLLAPRAIGVPCGLATAERHRQLRSGLLAALAVGLPFVVGGRWLLTILGVGVADFLIAGAACC